MRVLSIHQGADTGGTGWNLKRAFDEHSTKITFRSCAKKTNYINYQHDLDWTQARSEWRRANVVHLHNTLRTMRLFGNSKPFVLHHHGTHFRTNSETLNRDVAASGGRGVVSTLDLLRFGDGLTWIPQAHRVDIREPQISRRTKKIRVGHAPTNRAVKDTDAFLAACERLGVEPVLIEGQSWADCLALKATCDVLYDQVQLGYGNNAIEAWALGIPVIAGASEEILSTMRNEFGQLPFLTATVDTLGDAIAEMTNRDTRQQWAETGQAHIERWHDGRESVQRLTAIYRELAA